MTYFCIARPPAFTGHTWLFLVAAGTGRYCGGQTMAEPVYKILSEQAFAEAWQKGEFAGSTDDLRDGFIHLSASHQLEGTLAKHYQGEAGLVLLALDPGRLGSDLKWEPSRGGALFPHLYAPLDLGALIWSEPIELGPDGRHVVPERVWP
jgi:uncharacterized protein (DUF952 family)